MVCSSLVRIRDRAASGAARGAAAWSAVTVSSGPPAPGTKLEAGRRVALVVYQAPSISRSLGVQALERTGLPYRVTCTVRGVLGVVAAARAGLGVAIFARSLVPGDLVELPASAGLPDVGAIDLTLLTNPRSATEPAEALTAAILASGHPVKSRQD